MNTNPPSPSAESDAACWAARLDSGTFTPADRQELEIWLAADPRNRPLLGSYCQFSTDLEHLLPTLDAEGRLEPAAASARPSRTPVWRPWALVVSLAAAFAIAWFALPYAVNPTIERIATAATQRQIFALSDGSTVQLNAHSSIEYSLTTTERRVRLANGQAFFAVAKDPTRPFIVETPAGSVRVTGTHFDVRTDVGVLLEVTVEEGSVQVRLGENSSRSDRTTYPLQAGHRLTAGTDRVTVETLTPEDVADVLAWRDGIIVFKGTPLAEALDRFARYHGHGISATRDVADLPVGGRYSLDDLDGFFASLEEFLPVRVTRELSGTIIVRSRKKA